MQTRRDQLQAYRFVTRRIVSALLSGEPETTERPMRRFGLAVFGSAMLATIVFAGVGVYGFIFPSGAKLPDPAIVIERETGARYVFIDGQLHPVLNYASARLLLGSEEPAVSRVSQRSLRAYPRGQAVGIANLPDPLPDRSAITSGAWSACSMRRSPGSSEFVTNLIIGEMPQGGEALGDRALLLEQSTSANIRRWLVMGGKRMQVSNQALAPLGLAGARPVKATNSLIDGIPPGPDLAVPTIPGQGEDGPRIDGKAGKIGQVYLAAGQHYVLLRSGLATVGPIMKDLLLASGGNATTISANAATAARSAATPNFDPDGFPTAIPEVAFETAEPAMVCALAEGAETKTNWSPTIVLHDQLDGVELGELGTARTGPDGVRLADHVTIPAGRAALVRTLSAPGDTTANTTTYLVTDLGVKYALPRQDTAKVIASLGYGGLTAQPVPTFLLSLLPIGPTLDPKLAGDLVKPEAPTTPGPTTTSTNAPTATPTSTGR
jgi:type VII secretion protein EccB